MKGSAKRSGKHPVGPKIGDGLELEGMFRGAPATPALLYGQKREPETESVILDGGLPRLFYPQRHDIVNRYLGGGCKARRSQNSPACLLEEFPKRIGPGDFQPKDTRAPGNDRRQTNQPEAHGLDR